MSSMLVRHPMDNETAGPKAGGFGLTGSFDPLGRDSVRLVRPKRMKDLPRWGGGWCLWPLFDYLGPGPTTTLPSERTIAGNL